MWGTGVVFTSVLCRQLLKGRQGPEMLCSQFKRSDQHEAWFTIQCDNVIDRNNAHYSDLCVFSLIRVASETYHF